MWIHFSKSGDSWGGGTLNEPFIYFGRIIADRFKAEDIQFPYGEIDIADGRHASFGDIVTTGQWPAFDPARTVLLETAPGGKSDRRAGSVRIVGYANTEVAIEADSPDGGFVVLNDIWHPWWFADVDGAPADVLKANVLFRAAAVPPGRHMVTFRFQPLKGLWQALREGRGRTEK